MGHILCFLTPAILITLLHIFKIFLMEDKYNFFEILGYYLKASVIINIVMILIVFIRYQVLVWNYEVTNSFIIKYIILGSFLGLFLPYLYYKIRVFKRGK